MKMWQSLAKDDRKQDTIIMAAYAVMMAAVLAICLFLPWILYAKKRDTVPNVLLLPLGVLAVWAVYRAAGYLTARMKPGAKKRLLLFGSLAAWVVQMVMMNHYYFYTDWDVETIVESAMAAATGADISKHGNYFSMCPNNLVLVTLFGWVIRAAYALGMAEHAYFALLIFQSLICCVTGMLLCLLADHLLHDDALTAVAWVLYQLLVGLSPWISIPYSDGVALFFPTAILAVIFLLPKAGAKGMLRMFLLAFLSYFGYRIKPQIVIVLIALALYRAAGVLFGKALRLTFRPVHFAKACSFAAGLLCGVLLANGMAAQVSVPIDEEKRLGIAHYLMMGMNPEGFGVFVQQDVSLSWRCETNAARTQKNLEVFGERVSQLGAAGVAKHLVRKTLTNFNDGTFCWAGEGVFYREILEEKDSVLSPLLRSVYYSHTGKAYPIWANFAQTIWMGLLALASCAWLYGKDGRLSVIMFSIIGLTIFETVFEARARYLFIFVPLFILLCVAGMSGIKENAAGIRKFFRRRS